MKNKLLVKDRTGRSGHNGIIPSNIILYFAIIGLCGVLLNTTFKPILQRMAIISAAVSMPEGTLQLIRDRFSGNIEETMPLPVQPSSGSSQTDEQPSSSQSSGINESSDSQSGDSPSIDDQFKGTVLEEQFMGKEDSGYIKYNSAWLRNYTKLTTAQINTQLKKPLELTIPKTKSPTVLIIHTHATESFEEYESSYYDMRNSWRTTDNNKNMVRLGNELTTELEAAGLSVIHDTTQHDYPSYNGAYERSAVTIKNYLKKYPTIKVIFDMHRDAIEREGNIVVAPTVSINGKKAAQIMVIAGCDNGLMNMPNWSSNLRFAAALTSKLESTYPGLTRPILFDYRKYNMGLSKGLLLIEFGAGGNSLDEAIYSAQLAGKATAELLLELQK